MLFKALSVTIPPTPVFAERASKAEEALEPMT